MRGRRARAFCGTLNVLPILFIGRCGALRQTGVAFGVQQRHVQHRRRAGLPVVKHHLGRHYGEIPLRSSRLRITARSVVSTGGNGGLSFFRARTASRIDRATVRLGSSSRDSILRSPGGGS